MSYKQQIHSSTKPAVRELQLLVDTSIRQVGGYWRPLSALARLLEELAELAELIRLQDPNTKEVASEIADLFVISTCLANQYCAHLDEEYDKLGYPIYIDDVGEQAEVVDRSNSSLLNLVSASGQIARILNHYEGDKRKKPGEKHHSLAHAVAKFQTVLLIFARTFQLSILPAVEHVLNRSISRDKLRFNISHDPITEPSLERFKSIVNTTRCPFANKAKLWGSYEWDMAKSLEDNVINSIPTLIRFVRCAEQEELDGFVFEVYGEEYSNTFPDMCRTVKKTLNLLSNLDPVNENCMRGDLLSKDWQFSFSQQRFFVSVFAPCYPENHCRYSHNPKSIFLFFQPEFSFDVHGIHKDNSNRHKIKNKIRKSFAEVGSAYDVELVNQGIEAYLYIMPLRVGDKPVRWWDT
jgi:FPC/CPF motif-containing protein YcgG